MSLGVRSASLGGEPELPNGFDFCKNTIYYICNTLQANFYFIVDTMKVSFIAKTVKVQKNNPRQTRSTSPEMKARRRNKEGRPQTASPGMDAKDIPKATNRRSTKAHYGLSFSVTNIMS